MSVAGDIGKTLRIGALYGTEIEVEAVGMTYADKFSDGLLANITEDGSLRNGGVEFISKPLTFVDSLRFFREVFKNTSFTGPSELRHTSRTSTHVHVNVTDLSAEAVRNLVLNYFVLEAGFFNEVSEDRKNNIYCVPISATNMMSRFSRTNLYDIAREGNWHKYTAFNLLPMLSQGSIEFRHLQGTGDLHVYSQWLQYIDNWRALCRNGVPDSQQQLLTMYKHVFEKQPSPELQEKLLESFMTLQLIQGAIEKGTLVRRIKEHKACAA